MSAKRAAAGRRGADVRSDAWVELELRSQGGRELELKSKVEVAYGEATRKLLLQGLEHFGIEHARLTVEDQGALPFVLMARLEAALRRLDPSVPQPPWLPEAGFKPRPSERKAQRRSRLYLPGNEPKFMLNAALHGADALIYDLEDSVAPAEKDAAQLLIRNALLSLDPHDGELMVRINQGRAGLADLKHVVPYGVQLLLLPKVESAEQVRTVAAHVQELRQAAGVTHPIWLMPIVESALGGWRAYEIASAHPDVVALAIGLEDYTADIGAERTLDGRESFWVRSQVVNGARAAGVQPIDTVFSDVADNEGLLASVREAKALGFEGKGCIHPRQIDVIHRGFAPTEAEIDKATRIVLAFEEAQRRGLAAVSLGSKMIDPPVVKRALRIVALAEGEGLLKQGWRRTQGN